VWEARLVRQIWKKLLRSAKTVCLSFHHELMKRTPGTFNAHRRIWLASQKGMQDAVVKGIFRA
jgi:predicted DsbA family dithiol-disulfide isomerase